MKTLKYWILGLVTVFAATIAPQAQAGDHNHRWYRDRDRHHHHHARVIVYSGPRYYHAPYGWRYGYYRPYRTYSYGPSVTIGFGGRLHRHR